MPAYKPSPICKAIRTLVVLEFDYNRRHRIVQPYLHGTSTPGRESLRAIQVGGQSRSRSFGSGKLWDVALIQKLRLTTTSFVPDDPDYNPNDSAFADIHCRVPRLATGPGR
jgi:hypothetical protein